MAGARIPYGLIFWSHLFPILGHGQVMVRGKVLDAATGGALGAAHVRLMGTDQGTVTLNDGSFTLPLPGSGPNELVITSIGYVPLHHRLVEHDLEHGGLVLRMHRQVVELPGVTIERPTPEVVYQRTDLHVGDHFINDDGVWVLTYERPRLWHPESEAGRQVYREARLHLLDTTFIERCSVRLPSEVVRLRHDHAQRIIVEGVRIAWSVSVHGDELYLQEMALTTLQDQVLPWTDSIRGQLLGSNHSMTYPAFEHIAYDAGTQGTHPICAVEDRWMMELFRSQYKYMSGPDKVIAMDLELETGIDREIIAGYMTQFHRDLYFEPPYAPLFVVNDTLCVFDHYQERIRRFLPDRTALDEIPITYQRERNWRTRLLQDPMDGSVYALFARLQHTWVRPIEISAGRLGAIRQLEHPYPEDIQIHGGHAYYIHRPYGSLQRRTLYRQPIR